MLIENFKINPSENDSMIKAPLEVQVLKTVNSYLNLNHKED
jgi:hypothetical protein